jgi:hypothetical protein
MVDKGAGKARFLIAFPIFIDHLPASRYRAVQDFIWIIRFMLSLGFYMKISPTPHIVYL